MPAIDQNRLEEFLGKAVGDIGAAMSAALVLVGDRLGLYKALGVTPMTSLELATRTGTSERMVREWLLNQAAGGYIRYDIASKKYSMSPEQAFALADETSPAFLPGAFEIIQSIMRDEPKVTEAFKTGRGVPWGAHDSCLFCGTERFFGPNYRGNLVATWIPALDNMDARLKAGAAVADVGCGHGISTLLMAKAFPLSKFTGLDLHPASIECARKRAAEGGLPNVSFEVADATNFASPQGGFDLIACFDCLHDMGDPAGCAAHVRRSLRTNGIWMIVEPNAADRVEENFNPVGRLFSAASTMICVPAALAQGTSSPALGACAGPAKLKEVVTKAGFTKFRVATTTAFNLVIEARP